MESTLTPAAFPYLGIIFVPLFILYYTFACFYRASSREVKRVDSTVRLPKSPPSMIHNHSHTPNFHQLSSQITLIYPYADRLSSSISQMRSFVYASFGEMLTGVASVRAYHAEERFILKTERALDVQNRCYFVTIVLQRWLGVR